LRDGFPIYGRKNKDGTYSSTLDSNGGHTGATTEYQMNLSLPPLFERQLDSGFYVLKAGSYYGTKEHSLLR
jgi:hypothetical protein